MLLKYLILPLITACVVIIGIIISRYWVFSPQRPALSMHPVSNVQYQDRKAHAAKEASNSPQIATSHKDFVYPMDSTRDPFQQVSTPVAMQQSPGDARYFIMLTGIIWDEENPIAIITDSGNNSYLVRTGEEINRTKVIAIQPRSITIEKDGKTQELILWPAEL